MKQRNLSTKTISDALKANMVLETQKEFMLDTSETIKEKRTDLYEKIALFYLNEYLPTIRKHATLMTLGNKLNIALVSRGVISESDVRATNELLDNKLKEMFSRDN